MSYKAKTPTEKVLAAAAREGRLAKGSPDFCPVCGRIVCHPKCTSGRMVWSR